MWAVFVVLALSVLCAGLQVLAVRPYLWPAGTGAALAGDPAAARPLLARPPDPRTLARPRVVDRVWPGTPAARAGVRPGDLVLPDTTNPPDEALRSDPSSAERLMTRWRDEYWQGLRGPVTWRMAAGGGTRTVTLERPLALGTPAGDAWARRHAGALLQVVVFTAAALLLLALRSNDVTAALAVLALALSATGGAGPLLGAERVLPRGLRACATVFAWTASPLAFPIIALAILYFPTPSPLLVRRRALLAVPWLAAAPMLLPSLATALYLSGVTGLAGLAAWDASHPGVFLGSFAAALAVNTAALAEGVQRYRGNADANERRRIRMAVYSAVPGVCAYALKDGIPVLASLGLAAAPLYPGWVEVVLQGLVLLPAFGLVYAVGVERVLGPRIVLRRSLQYALARRTLTVLVLLPAAALAISIARNRTRTIGELATSRAGLYATLIAASAAALTYREGAQRWLDERFFRAEYDAREILLSLAGRVRFETDPADLVSLVVGRIDAALHPETVAVLVSGVDEGRLTPVTVLRGSVESLPLDGGLAAMLHWSDEPLEIFPQDPRSPARRLPPEEREWLECTRASLLVPVAGDDRALVAVIVLGARLSEEAYTPEDRQLLASIATQMALGFDVARLRRQTTPRIASAALTTAAASSPLLAECPACGRCEEAGTGRCPEDGSPMQSAGAVPRNLDGKYRIDRIIGRGGMGAVYRARDMRLDRDVAIKVILSDLVGNPEARRRFRQEAQVVARLQHPSIVSIFDYATLDGGGAYLVMEFVPGEDLRRVLRREGRLPPPRTVTILRSVCAAIEAAHQGGVLHRDLKPENILLLPGGEPPAMVLDFGVAKVTSNPPADAGSLATAPGIIVGTPAYMAPEQFDGRAPDARTDVFALGVIAWEMLCGELPFGGGPLMEVVLAQARGPRAAPQGVMPEGMEHAVRAALDADPRRRPASAAAFAQRLDAALRG